MPFSAMPTSATSDRTPTSDPGATAPPSSVRKAADTCRSASVCAMSRAPRYPPFSSSSPKAKYIVRFGWKPRPIRISAASMIDIRLSLSSSVPRPQMSPPLISPEKGGRVHLPSVAWSTGTTSMCASRMIGFSEGSEPAQV